MFGKCDVFGTAIVEVSAIAQQATAGTADNLLNAGPQQRDQAGIADCLIFTDAAVE